MKERMQQRDGDGVLFAVQEKESDKHPDYTGSITIGGVACWLSGWRRESKKGVKYMSLAAKPKEQMRAPTPKKTDDFDDQF